MPNSLRASLLICLVCSIAVAHAQEVKDGKTIIRNGNTFVMSAVKYDTVFEKTAEGETIRLYSTAPYVLRMNGEQVYDIQEVTTRPQNRKGKLAFEQYVLSNLKPLMKTFPSGKYNLFFSDMVVDKTGKIVYYEYIMQRYDSNGEWSGISDNANKLVKVRAEEIISIAPLLIPATMGGKKVVANYLSDIDEYTIGVADGVVAWAKKEG